MNNGSEGELFETAVLALKDSIANTPKFCKKLRLKSLLEKFGFKVRTAERIRRLSEAFAEAGVVTDPDISVCDREDWITLSLDISNSSHSPTEVAEDPWFYEVTQKNFATEKEVEIRFIVPLLQRLGYSEEDRADGFPIEIIVGSKRTKAEADFVLFDGSNRSMDNALLVVEAKRSDKRVANFVSQARSYAMFMGTPYYMVTNGNDILILQYQSPLESDRVVFTGTRNTLREDFPSLYKIIGKPHAISRNAVRRWGQK